MTVLKLTDQEASILLALVTMERDRNVAIEEAGLKVVPVVMAYSDLIHNLASKINLSICGFEK